MGLSNVIPMEPFCRTPEEGDRVLEEMARSGLVRGENGLEVYGMCELPSNVIAAEAFAERFDGFSIGSNDLTQLTLGLDRDSALVAELFDERHPPGGGQDRGQLGLSLSADPPQRRSLAGLNLGR